MVSVPSGGRRLARVLATCGGIGYVPVVPGTFGTLAAVPLAWAVALADRPLLTGFVLIFLIPVGIWSAGVVEADRRETDPGPVVVDEVAGFLATVAFLPPRPGLYLAAFFLFRALDIAKPPPARAAEKFPGGLGIMADDLIVGVYGNLLLRAGLYLLDRL